MITNESWLIIFILFSRSETIGRWYQKRTQRGDQRYWRGWGGRGSSWLLRGLCQRWVARPGWSGPGAHGWRNSRVPEDGFFLSEDDDLDMIMMIFRWSWSWWRWWSLHDTWFWCCDITIFYFCKKNFICLINVNFESTSSMNNEHTTYVHKITLIFGSDFSLLLIHLMVTLYNLHNYMMSILTLIWDRIVCSWDLSCNLYFSEAKKDLALLT